MLLQQPNRTKSSSQKDNRLFFSNIHYDVKLLKEMKAKFQFSRKLKASLL